MALVLKDRVRETTTVLGTNDATLLGAVTGFQAFSVVGNGNTCYYTIADQSGGNWEVGIGTYSTVGPTLARTTILASSNSGSIVSFPAGTKDVFLTYPSERAVYLDAAGNLDIEGAVVINANTSSDAVRITQSGSGNALLVEDSANPDSTPFVIDSSGNVVIGATTSQFSYPLEIYTTASKGIVFKESSADSNYNTFYFRKSRGTTPASMDIVSNNDGLGAIYFQGTDGVIGLNAAGITAVVDGVPGVNDMPGRLVFSTTADGASSPTERMRIDSAGAVGIGSTSLVARRVNIGGNVTGAVSGYGIVSQPTFQSDVTTLAVNYYSGLNTQAAAFTVANYRHFQAIQATIGAGSTVTNQYGFFTDSSLTGATNNYGFYSNIASGTGRYNFYAAGSANNYFAGIVGVGVADQNDSAFAVNKQITSGTTTYGIRNFTTVPSNTTLSYNSFESTLYTQAAAFTLTNYSHFTASSSALGAGSAVTNQIGFYALNTITTATNNYGFKSDIAAGTGRWNFYAAGTAANYFAGNVSSAGTIAAVSGATSSATLDPIGALELLYASGPYIDFKTSNVDYDCRIQQNSNGLIFQTGGSGSAFTSFNIKSNGNQDTFGTGEVFQAIYRNSAGATNNYVGNHTWWAKNASGNYVTQGRFIVQQNAITAGAETSSVSLQATKGGTSSSYIGFSGDTDTVIFSTNGGTERMRIDSAGRVGIGATPNAGEVLNVSKNPVGDGSGIGFTIRNYGTIQSSVTSTYYGNIVNVNTQAAAFTLSNLQYHTASQGTFGAGSSVTTQYGFHAASNLTGATNNYGFYSNIASGTGRYNFYAAGTADNYFAGSTGFGTTVDTINKIIVGGTLPSGSAQTGGIRVVGTIPSTTTSTYISYDSVPATQAASFTLSNMFHYRAYAPTIGAGSAITSQSGLYIDSGLTNATNNFGVFSNIASGTGRYNFYASGSADNYMAGSLGVGQAPSGWYGLNPRLLVVNNQNAETSLGIGNSTVGASASISLRMIGGTGNSYKIDWLLDGNGSPYHTVDFGSAVLYTRYTFGNTQRFQITNSGATNVGGGAAEQHSLMVNRDIGGNTLATGIYSSGIIQSSVTSAGQYFRTAAQTAAAAFTTNVYHYTASQGTFGAGSTVSNQFGFIAESSLTGATNNYGVRSDIASGTGRYNFYAGGTADNYFAGNVGVGAAPVGATTSKMFIGGGVTLTNTNTVLFSNLYYASGFKYVGNGYGSFIKLTSSSNALEFFYAGNNSSGAGAAATTVAGFVVDYNGNVLVIGSGGIGYGTGSGGAVTQATSRTTGVTLNKTNGAITLVSAAGSATYQAFTVTNSTVAATDTIIVNQKSGTDKYIILVTAVAAGSFAITFATTGGTTTEQPVFNFAVIKAVTA